MQAGFQVLKCINQHGTCLMAYNWRSDITHALGGDGFIPGDDHANLCPEWNTCKSVSACPNSPYFYMSGCCLKFVTKFGWKNYP